MFCFHGRCQSPRPLPWCVQIEAPGERFLAFKELLINNGLSNTRNALRSALAIAELTNRTLMLPQARSAVAAHTDVSGTAGGTAHVRVAVLESSPAR